MVLQNRVYHKVHWLPYPSGGSMGQPISLG
jgi:hypothetical protein